MNAALKAAEAIDARFGLSVGGGGSYRQFDRSEPWHSVSGDYFFATTGALTSRSGHIEIDCEWLADGRTRVVMTSDLPEAQYTIIAAEVRRALTMPSTQPNATDRP